MSEIKPKMVDGEAVCDPGCRSCFDGHICDITRQPRVEGVTCWPYYRARVAELEQQVSAYDDAHKATMKARFAAEAENERLRGLYDREAFERGRLISRYAALHAVVEEQREELIGELRSLKTLASMTGSMATMKHCDERLAALAGPTGPADGGERCGRSGG